MSTVSAQVYEYVRQLPYAGSLPDANAVGVSSLAGKAPRTTLFLRINDGRVTDFRFQTQGCGFLIACCASIGDFILNKAVAECELLQPEDLIRHLGGVPAEREFCARLALDALVDALGKRDASLVEHEVSSNS